MPSLKQPICSVSVNACFSTLSHCLPLYLFLFESCIFIKPLYWFFRHKDCSCICLLAHVITNFSVHSYKRDQMLLSRVRKKSGRKLITSAQRQCIACDISQSCFLYTIVGDDSSSLFTDPVIDVGVHFSEPVGYTVYSILLKILGSVKKMKTFIQQGCIKLKCYS